MTTRIKLASPLSEQATDHVGHALNTAMKETENKEGQHAQFSPKELLDLVNKHYFPPYINAFLFSPIYQPRRASIQNGQNRFANYIISRLVRSYPQSYRYR